MLRRAVFKGVSRSLLHPWFRLRRGLTLGVRCLVIDGEGQVLLVRHSYAPGWLLPGGGVERGETVYDAAAREMREEAGIIADETPRLLGLYANEENFPGDHLACFVVRQFHRIAWAPTLEIRAAEFHHPDALPAETTSGTRRRIAEALGEAVPSPTW